MKLPPKHTPKKPTAVEVAGFFADPFDPRFVEGEALTDRRFTPLGSMVQAFGFLRQHLMTLAPDAVKFLEKHQ